MKVVEGASHIGCPEVEGGRCKGIVRRETVNHMCGATVLAAYDKYLVMLNVCVLVSLP
jgi:hypothetical protein